MGACRRDAAHKPPGKGSRRPIELAPYLHTKAFASIRGRQAPKDGFTASLGTWAATSHKGLRFLDVLLPELGFAVGFVELVGLKAEFVVGDFCRLVALQHF